MISTEFESNVRMIEGIRVLPLPGQIANQGETLAAMFRVTLLAGL